MPERYTLPTLSRSFIALLAVLLLATRACAGTPAIAAAADLKFALEEVATQFRADSGKEVRLVFGSSGNFCRQIEQGAPFQMFLSADESYIERLTDAGLTRDRGTLYARGRIVLFAPSHSPLVVDNRFDGLRKALATGRIKHFAIANPEHAPYGRAARQALEMQGLWSAVSPRLVLGENVSQAAQFAAAGTAQGGIFAYSLAVAPQIASQGRHVLLPESWHQPLRQRMVLLREAGETARAFYRHMQTPPAQAILRRHGFMLPGE